MIKTKEIDKYVHNLLLKRNSEELTEDDISKVKKLILSGINLDGEEILYDFNDIMYFKNLESCTLEFFSITDELVDILNLLPNLSYLTINHSVFKTKNLKNKNIKTLIITYSNLVSLEKLRGFDNITSLELIDVGAVDLNVFTELRELKKIYIYNSKINNFSKIKAFSYLEELNLDGTDVDDECILNTLSNSIKVHRSDRFRLRS